MGACLFSKKKAKRGRLAARVKFMGARKRDGFPLFSTRAGERASACEKRAQFTKPAKRFVCSLNSVFSNQNGPGLAFPQSASFAIVCLKGVSTK